MFNPIGQSDGDFYGNLMTDEGRMVLANGAIMSRSEVTESLEHAPPWASYAIDDPSAVTLSDDVAVLIYTGTGHRDGGNDFIGIMSSAYVRRDSGWKLAHYQQTAKP